MNLTTIDRDRCEMFIGEFLYVIMGGSRWQFLLLWIALREESLFPPSFEGETT